MKTMFYFLLGGITNYRVGKTPIRDRSGKRKTHVFKAIKC